MKKTQKNTIIKRPENNLLCDSKLHLKSYYLHENINKIKVNKNYLKTNVLKQNEFNF